MLDALRFHRIIIYFRKEDLIITNHFCCQYIYSQRWYKYILDIILSGHLFPTRSIWFYSEIYCRLLEHAFLPPLGHRLGKHPLRFVTDMIFLIILRPPIY